MGVIAFSKVQAAGNDFIIIDNRKKIFKNSFHAYAKHFCDRKKSIGADGLIFLEPSAKVSLRMHFINADGSQAEMCGNGVRCLAKYAVDNKIAPPVHSIETLSGIIAVEVKGQIVKAKLINPVALMLNRRLIVAGKKELWHSVNTGVPHAVTFLKSIAVCDVDRRGRLVRHHSSFAPRGSNVNFVELRSKNSISVRTYERGVEGETHACGTGSSASALIAAALKGLASPVTVHTKGGDKLTVYFLKDKDKFRDVYLEGAVFNVFQGRIEI